MKIFQLSNYIFRDIISDAELHADSESGTILLWLLLTKKLFSINCFYTMMLITKNRRFFTGISTLRRSFYELQICSRGAFCNFRPLFLFNLLQWPIIRQYFVWGPLYKFSKIGYRGRYFFYLLRLSLLRITGGHDISFGTHIFVLKAGEITLSIAGMVEIALINYS